MKVKLDKSLCFGHAHCMAKCPEVYGSDELGNCVILMEEIPKDLQARAALGAKSCPEGALTIVDD